MIDFQKQFESEKVWLRPLRRSDQAEMAPLTADPGMWKYFTADLSQAAALEAWIEAGIADPGRLALGIVDVALGQLIGSTSIGNVSLRDRRAEIGWTWLAKAYQGKGYNAHVKGLLLGYLFEACQAERVELKTDVLNIPARRAAQKIGFVQEGILRSHTLMTQSRRRDTIFYSVLRHEWEGVKRQNQW